VELPGVHMLKLATLPCQSRQAVHPCLAILLTFILPMPVSSRNINVSHVRGQIHSTACLLAQHRRVNGNGAQHLIRTRRCNTCRGVQTGLIQLGTIPHAFAARILANGTLLHGELSPCAKSYLFTVKLFEQHHPSVDLYNFGLLKLLPTTLIPHRVPPLLSRQELPSQNALFCHPLLPPMHLLPPPTQRIQINIPQHILQINIRRPLR
jgi:hypothetical protein